MYLCVCVCEGVWVCMCVCVCERVVEGEDMKVESVCLGTYVCVSASGRGCA